MSGKRERATSAQVRIRLTEAALDSFHRNGYHATGIQEIAAQAGIPKGSVYNHFDNKQALARAAIEQYAAQSPIQQLVDPEYDGVAAVTEHFLELRRRFVDSDHRRGCLLGNLATEVADHHEEVRDHLRVALDGWVALLACALDRAQQAGTISSAIPAEQVAGLLLDAWEGCLVRARGTGTSAPIDGFFTALPHLLGQSRAA